MDQYQQRYKLLNVINYPNHNQERFRKKCNNPLIKKIDSSKDSSDNPIFHPIMIFPLVSIKQQLALFLDEKTERLHVKSGQKGKTKLKPSLTFMTV